MDYQIRNTSCYAMFATNNDLVLCVFRLLDSALVKTTSCLFTCMTTLFGASFSALGHLKYYCYIYRATSGIVMVTTVNQTGSLYCGIMRL